MIRRHVLKFTEGTPLSCMNLAAGASSATMSGHVDIRTIKALNEGISHAHSTCLLLPAVMCAGAVVPCCLHAARKADIKREALKAIKDANPGP